MTNEQLAQYIDLKARISELEEELDQLKTPILVGLMDCPNDKHEFQGMGFSISRRNTYAYSDKVNELEEVLKSAKAHERKEGIATITASKAVLVMKPKTEKRP